MCLLGIALHRYIELRQSCNSSFDSAFHAPCEATRNNKQLLDEVFVISGIIKVEVSVISLGLLAQLNTLTSTLIYLDITKTEAKNCFIIHCFEINNNKCTVAQN